MSRHVCCQSSCLFVTLQASSHVMRALLRCGAGAALTQAAVQEVARVSGRGGNPVQQNGGECLFLTAAGSEGIIKLWMAAPVRLSGSECSHLTRATYTETDSCFFIAVALTIPRGRGPRGQNAILGPERVHMSWNSFLVME